MTVKFILTMVGIDSVTVTIFILWWSLFLKYTVFHPLRLFVRSPLIIWLTWVLNVCCIFQLQMVGDCFSFSRSFCKLTCSTRCRVLDGSTRRGLGIKIHHCLQMHSLNMFYWSRSNVSFEIDVKRIGESQNHFDHFVILTYGLRHPKYIETSAQIFVSTWRNAAPWI